MAQFTVNICQVGRILSKHRCLIIRDFFSFAVEDIPGSICDESSVSNHGLK